VTDLLTYDQAAARLGFSVRTLSRRIKAGDIPVFADVGIKRVRAVDVDRYIAERTSARGWTPAAAGPAGVVVPEGLRLWDLEL
jgi:excisionase family DNA binding protein